MATVRYTANAKPVQQVSTVQVTAFDAATTYIITINGKDVSVVGVTSTTLTAAALQEALSASTFPEFQEITWTVNGTTVTGTAVDAGMPFTYTKSTSGGTGTLGAVTTTVAASGPGLLSLTANYSTGALPAGGDTLIFENLQNINLLDDTGALSGINLALIDFRNCSGNIGLPVWNGRYNEYRNTYVALRTAILNFDCPDCQLARINSQTYVVEFVGEATGSPSIANLPALVWKGTNASNVLKLNSGSYGVAMFAGEVATILTLYVGYITQPESDVKLTLGAVGSVVTLGGGIDMTGGSVELFGSGMTGNVIMRIGAQRFVVRGTSGTYPLFTIHSGALEWLAGGTITNMTLGSDTTFDASRSESTFTITNAVQGFKDCSFLDPMVRATWAGIKANGCKVTDMTIDRGPDRTVTA